MAGCVVPTKKKTACPHEPSWRGLCKLHDPDGTYASQHPGYRARLLALEPVKRAMAKTKPKPVVAAPARKPVVTSTPRPAQSAPAARPPAAKPTRDREHFLVEADYLLKRAQELLDGDRDRLWEIKKRRWLEDLVELQRMRQRLGQR